MIQKHKKKLAMVLVALVSLTSFQNCFGKFSLIRKVYEFNNGINVGSGILANFVKTLVMYAMWIIPVYQIAGAVDLIILNLIEFWTGSNPIAYNEYDKDGIYVREFAENNEVIRFTYVNYGQRLNVYLKGQSGEHSFVILQSERGKIFQDNNGKLVETSVNASVLGNKTILKMAQNGKLKSSKIVETENLNELEAKYANFY